MTLPVDQTLGHHPELEAATVAAFQELWALPGMLGMGGSSPGCCAARQATIPFHHGVGLR